jgi:hypothetical protein
MLFTTENTYNKLGWLLKAVDKNAQGQVLETRTYKYWRKNKANEYAQKVLGRFKYISELK